MAFDEEYLTVIQRRFYSVKKLGDDTLSQLSDEDIQWRLNEQSNSISVIVKHMYGNMLSRWTDFLITDGEKTTRNRDEEFNDTVTMKEDVHSLWEEGWGVVLNALEALEPADLGKTITIRGEAHSVIDAIERQLAHYAYHVGQVVYIGKQIKGRDWKTLSIPIGKSQEYLEDMLKKHGSDK